MATLRKPDDDMRFSFRRLSANALSPPKGNKTRTQKGTAAELHKLGRRFLFPKPRGYEIPQPFARRVLGFNAEGWWSVVKLDLHPHGAQWRDEVNLLRLYQPRLVR